MTTIRQRPPGLHLEEGGRGRRLRLTWDLALMSAVVVITSAILLGAPVKGLADNGDYQRIMQGLGVQPVASEPMSAAVLTQYYVTGLPVTEPLPRGEDTAAARAYYYGAHGYASSQLLVDKVALGVGTALSDPRRFDIRWIGVTNGLVLVFGIGLVLLALRQLGRAARIAASVLVALAFTDFGYLEYLNSFFSEPSELTFLLAAVGSAGAIPVLRGRPQNACFACYLVSTGLFVWAKEGNYLSALPLIALAPWLAWRYFAHWWPRVTALASCALLAVTVWLSLGISMPYYNALHYYDSVFDGIMPSAPTPQTAAQELGLPASLAQYSGYTAYQGADDAMARPGIQAEFFDRISYSKLVRFYAGHPATLVAALSYASGTSLDLRVPYLSNLSGSSGVKYAPRSPWTVLHADVLPRSLWFILAVPGLTIAAGAAGLLRRRPRAGPASDGLLIALGLMAILDFAQAVVGDGFNELIKHQFLFNVTFDLCLIADVAVVITWLGTLHGPPGRDPAGESGAGIASP